MQHFALAILLATQIASSERAADALPSATAAPTELRWLGAPAHVDGLAQAIVRAADKGDPWTLARLLRLENFRHLHDAPEAIERATEAIIKSKRVDALTQDHARYMQAQLHIRQGQDQQAQDHLESIQMVRGGWLLGPFDNPAGAGHDTPYGPELTADPESPVTTRAGISGWRPLSGLAPQGVLELSHLLHPSNEATAYLAVALKAERRTKAALRTGSTDALKVWVNGQPALDIDRRRFAALDQDAASITLNPGLNLVLAKVSWAADTGQLLLRVSRPEGGPLPGVQIVSDRRAVFDALRSFKTVAGPPPAPGQRLRTVRSRLERATSANELALLADLVAVLGLYDRRVLPLEPEALLVQAVHKAPHDPRLFFFLAHRIRDRDPSRARRALHQALIADPGYAPAWVVLGQLARQGGLRMDARQHLDRALAADENFAAAQLARASLGYELLDEDVLAVARLSKSLRPPSVLATQPSLHLQLSRMQRGVSDRLGARQSAQRALELNQDDEVARALVAELALEASDIPASLSHLAESVLRRPFSLHARSKYARVLMGQPGRLNEALETLTAAQQVFVQHPRVHKLLAELHLFAERTPAALQALAKARALDNHDPGLRQHQRVLSGGSAELEDEYALQPAEVAKRARSPEEERFGAAFLSDRKVIRLFEDGRTVRFQQSILRLSNPQLEDALRGHRIDYSPSRESVQILAAERIRPNGQVSTASQIRDEGPRGKVSGMYVDQRYKLIIFDRLEAGDLVHLQYRVDALGSNIFAGFFGDVTAVQSRLPKQDFFYRVITPKQRLLYDAQIRVPQPQAQHQGDLRTLTWQLEDVPGLQVEPLAPPYPDLGRLISVSTYEDWDALGGWYGRLFSEQMQLDDDARQAGRLAVKGATSDEEKVRRLYNYVVKNTRYVGIELGIHGWKPFPASEVHRRRYGDCKDKVTLLSALLRDNGVEATITLVRTVDRGALPQQHATMWAFNHAIAYVPGQDLFLDPTAEFNGSTELPHQDQGAMALVVYPDGRTQPTTLPISSPDANLNASVYEATLGRDTQLSLRGKERFKGARAAELRRQMQEADQRIRLLEQPLAQIFPGVTVTEANFSDLNDLESEVSYEYAFDVPKYGFKEGNKLSFPVSLYRHEVAAAYAQLAERQSDLHTSHAWKTQNVIRYRLPKDAKLTVLPKGQVIDTPYIALHQRVVRTEDGFETDDIVTFKKRIVPAKAYPEFREACLAIDRAMARTVEVTW